MEMKLLAESKLKATRYNGAIRLWIEGTKLAKAGFKRNDSYTIKVVKSHSPELQSGLMITKDSDGKNKVSGRDRNGKELPIIDRKNTEWDELFGEKLNVKFYDGFITVS
jgi:hypothetical protein